MEEDKEQNFMEVDHKLENISYLEDGKFHTILEIKTESTSGDFDDNVCDPLGIPTSEGEACRTFLLDELPVQSVKQEFGVPSRECRELQSSSLREEPVTYVIEKTEKLDNGDRQDETGKLFRKEQPKNNKQMRTKARKVTGAVSQNKNRSKRKPKTEARLRVVSESSANASDKRRRIHAEEEEEDAAYECDVCGKHYRTKRRLREHISAHDRGSSFETCGRDFAKIGHLKAHLRVHGNAFKGNAGLEEHAKAFPCPDCVKTFARKRTLDKHTRIHAANAFSCTLCDKTFKRRYHAKRHEATHSREEDAAYDCDLCGKRYRTKHRLREHISAHDGGSSFETCGRDVVKLGHLKSDLRVHGKAFKGNAGLEEHAKAFACPDCDKTFAIKRILDKHAVSHTGNVFSCTLCNKTFKRRYHAKRHEATHSERRPFACETRLEKHAKAFPTPDCNKTLAIKPIHDKHATTHAVNLFSCTLCDKVFSRRYHAKRHEATHSERRPFACETCGQRFESETKLGAHAKRKHEAAGALFSCRECGASFALADSLTRHLSTHSGKRTKNDPTQITERTMFCGECGETFRTDTLLRRHVNVAHNPEKKYSCSKCDRKFAEKKNLDWHAVVHAPKSFLCDVCGVAFNRKHTLAAHVLSHGKTKSFSCKICGRIDAFSTLGIYRRHMKEKHPGKYKYDAAIN